MSPLPRTMDMLDIELRSVMVVATVTRSGKWEGQVLLFPDNENEDVYEIEWIELGDTSWEAITNATIRIERELRESTPEHPVRATA